MTRNGTGRRYMTSARAIAVCFELQRHTTIEEGRTKCVGIKDDCFAYSQLSAHHGGATQSACLLAKAHLEPKPQLCKPKRQTTRWKLDGIAFPLLFRIHNVTHGPYGNDGVRCPHSADSHAIRLTPHQMFDLAGLTSPIDGRANKSHEHARGVASRWRRSFNQGTRDMVSFYMRVCPNPRGI